MTKLTDVVNEDALDLLADILEPAVKICSDSEVKKLFGNSDKVKVAKHIIKEHKSEIIEILATLDGVKVEEYRCNVITLPLKVLELMNDKELLDFFTQYASEMEA